MTTPLFSRSVGLQRRVVVGGGAVVVVVEVAVVVVAVAFTLQTVPISAQYSTGLSVVPVE